MSSDKYIQPTNQSILDLETPIGNTLNNMKFEVNVFH